jgi:predicted Rossmann-fold nucleotide-binding protein
MKSLAVFCGSSSGNNELYAVHAKMVGRKLGEGGFRLVYGGAIKD